MSHQPLNIAVLCNPRAAAGRSVELIQPVTGYLTTNGFPFQLFIDNWPDTFTGFTDVFLIGGDGTLNYFINRYPDSGISLTLFKGGTGNDFHWLLYGQRSLDDQLQLGVAGDSVALDIGCCNGRYFINGIGIGFEGAVVKSLVGKKKMPGKASFLLTILARIFSYRSAEYTVVADGQRFSGRKLMVDVCNGQRAGGGFLISPLADPADGVLDLVIVNDLPPLSRLLNLPRIEKGKHLGLPFIHHMSVDTVTIASASPFSYHLDGEYAEATSVEVAVIPKGIRFRL